jgi:hypothetical protein
LVGDNKERIGMLSSMFGGELIPIENSIWRGTKEIVYQHSAPPVFTHIMYYLDADTLDIVLEAGVETVDLDEEGVREHLALAVAAEIPVFPNTLDDLPHLEIVYTSILEHGVMLSSGGEKRRYRFTDCAAPISPTKSPEEHLVTSRVLNPVEVINIRRRIAGRLSELTAAETTLGKIDAAVHALENCLETTARNEHSLQACLTSHPILFGPEYRRVIPQHKLGSDYVMDYALERHSGFFDLVEIESSTLDLFTVNGEPRSGLIHAEQQIYDWLEWIEVHGGYAREKLPTLQRPRGIIVIGRSSSLTDATRTKLRQRNRILAEVLEICTYDDLLTRTRSLRELLLANANGSADSAIPG